MTAFTLMAPFVDAALLAVATDKTRYYLRGIYLDPGGWLVALNGTTMFAAKDSGALAQDMIIPVEALAAVQKGKSAQYQIKPLQEGLYLLSRGSLTTTFKPVDGTFPSWRRVVPDLPSSYDETPASFDPKETLLLGKMADILGGGKGSQPSTRFQIIQRAGGSCPVLFSTVKEGKGRATTEARDDVLAVVMALRSLGLSYRRSSFGLGN